MDELFKDNAMKEFEVCFEKHMQKIKNSLYTIIGHAYRKGFEDGKKAAEPKFDTIEMGDEVCIDDNMHNTFIVTEYEPDECIGGITFKGEIHYHDSAEGDITKWKKTGRHYDVENVLKGWKELNGQ